MANALDLKQSRFLFRSLLSHLETSWPMGLLLRHRSPYPDRLIKKLLANGYQKIHKAFLFFSLAFLFIFFFFLLNVCQARYFDWDDISGDYNAKARAKGGTLELIDYVKILSLREPLDNLDTLEYKRSAIGYLLATGGPNGFRVEPATPDERVALLKALSFAAILHENLGDHDESFDLMEIRRLAHCRTPTETEKEHLRIAQTEFTATRALVKAGRVLPVDEFSASIKDLYQQDCRTILSLIFRSERERLQTFTQTFTKKLASRTKEAFEEIEKGLGISAHTVPLIHYSEDILRAYIQKFCCDASSSSASPYSSRFIPPYDAAYFNILTTRNGLFILRDYDGTINLKTTDRSVQVGRFSLNAASTYTSPIHVATLGISKYQNQEDFLKTIEAVCGIYKQEGVNEKSTIKDKTFHDRLLRAMAGQVDEGKHAQAAGNQLLEDGF